MYANSNYYVIYSVYFIKNDDMLVSLKKQIDEYFKLKITTTNYQIKQ